MENTVYNLYKKIRNIGLPSEQLQLPAQVAHYH